MSSPTKRSGTDPDGLPKAPNYRGMVVQGVKKQTRGDTARAGAGRSRAAAWHTICVILRQDMITSYPKREGPP